MRTSHRLLLVSPLSSIVMLCCAPGAHAQAHAINKCTVGGRIVFQSSPCAVEARPATGAAAEAVASTATQASDTPKKKTLADMLRERDGATPAQPARREFQQDGANVLRSRMGAV
jgi:hypothetical protein